MAVFPDCSLAHGIGALVVAFAIATIPINIVAQTQRPNPKEQGLNPKEMSGSVLPVADLPPGSVTVRIVRGNFNDLSGEAVELTVDGKKRVSTTGGNGRAEFTKLPRGAVIKAVAVIDGERLESKDAVVGDTGLRILLVATDPTLAKGTAADRQAAAIAPSEGSVVLGPESRIIIEMSYDRLTVFYILNVINSATTTVNTGGPLVFELPYGARGTRILEQSSQQATANGRRVTVVGPFAPGVTPVEVAYELPYTRGAAHLSQRWPAALDRVVVLVQQLGGIGIESKQLASKQEVREGDQPLIFGVGPGLAVGESLEISISGLPSHVLWPRNLALVFVGLIIAAGFWGVFTAPPRRQP